MLATEVFFKISASGVTETAYAISASGFEPLRLTRVVSVPTSEIRCNHCARVALEIKGNCLVVVSRHDGQYHKTVVSLEQLGLQWITNA